MTNDHVDRDTGEYLPDERQDDDRGSDYNEAAISVPATS